MKKICAFLLALCTLCAFIPPVFAAEATQDYEIVRLWEQLYVEIDAAAGKTDAVIAALKESGFAQDVRKNDSSPVYIGEKKENTDYITVVLYLPFRENNARVQALLAEYPCVLRVYQIEYGCEPSGDIFDMHHLMVNVDLSLCTVDNVLRELQAMEQVHSAEDISRGGDSGIANIVVSLEYPFTENRAAVLSVLQEKEYVLESRNEILVPEGSHQQLMSVNYPYGDVNQNDKVGADDARQILRYAVGLEQPKTFLEETLADIDCSGNITAADARLALRAAVKLDRLNYYSFELPKYGNLIAGKSVGLAKQGGRLLITASTTGAPNVTRCGFNYVKLQRFEKGLWTDVKEYCYINQFGNTNAKVFSAAVSPAPGFTYRVVCEHYAEAPYLKVFTQSAAVYNTSVAVTLA